jgi:hypothetical protein
MHTHVHQLQPYGTRWNRCPACLPAACRSHEALFLSLLRHGSLLVLPNAPHEFAFAPGAAETFRAEVAHFCTASALWGAPTAEPWDAVPRDLPGLGSQEGPPARPVEVEACRGQLLQGQHGPQHDRGGAQLGGPTKKRGVGLGTVISSLWSQWRSRRG